MEHGWRPSPRQALVSNLYTAVGDERPMSLPITKDIPTWDMDAVLHPGLFLPPTLPRSLLPPLPLTPAGVLCTPSLCLALTK